MKLVPVGDKVVVQRIEPEERTAGGIVLPDSARGQTSEGRILSVGEGLTLRNGERVEFQVSEGDRVLLSEFAGTDVTVDGEDLLVMRESDILAIIE